MISNDRVGSIPIGTTKIIHMNTVYIDQYAQKIKVVLIANHLGHLTNKLKNAGLMKTALHEHFTKLVRENKPIPVELDWIYAQYNGNVHFA